MNIVLYDENGGELLNFDEQGFAAFACQNPFGPSVYQFRPGITLRIKASTDDGAFVEQTFIIKTMNDKSQP
jgi:hypothetical protein